MFSGFDNKWRLFSMADPSSAQTDLFTRIHQMDRLSEELQRIMLLPKKKRWAWLEENEPQLTDMMDDLLESSDTAIEAMGDSQTQELSIEYVTKLRDLATIVRSILDDRPQLRS